MSWDVCLFNSRKKIDSLEEFDADKLEPVDFGKILEQHFKEIKKDGKHRKFTGNEFSISYFDDGSPSTNFMLSLYGEKAIYELVYLAKNNGWQIFDTGIGEMIDLDHPENNGYEEFQKYLKQILNSNLD